jgi:hypothetical protein
MSALRDTKHRAGIGWLLLFIVGFPHLIYYFGLSSSLTLGLGLVCLVVLYFSMNTQHGQPTIIVGKLNRDVSVVLVVVLILLHFSIASLISQTDIVRSGLSLIIVVLLILAASGLASVIASISDNAINQSVWFVFYFFCIVVGAYFFDLGPTGAHEKAKNIFPFNEPSLFTLSFMPFFIYSCVYSSAFYRYVIIFVVLAVAMTIQNMTLVVGCLIVVFICMNYKAALLSLFMAWVAASQFDLAYFFNRAIISPDSNNLSALVYLQGWQLIGESFERTMGIGMGFQQLGVLPTEVPASYAINSLIGGDDLNLKDGGFLLSKLLSEFGWFGILLAGVYLRVALRSFLQLRNIALRSDGRLHAIAI